MQFHLNGYRAGDPDVALAQQRPRSDHTDVLIVGCGPAGLTLAAQLAQFPDIDIRIVEQKAGPLTVGQADGIACRSMEMFQAFGFAEKLAREAYWVNETCFWRPRPDGSGIARADRIQDVEDGLSEFPHTILNQARVHDFYLELMGNAAQRLVPDYRRRLRTLEAGDDPDYPVTAVLECLERDDGATEQIHARYVVGCDGARSTVRRCLGHPLRGEAARQLWGVMDVFAVTDFPDVRLKCAIQSAQAGSMLIIPREGGYMVRLYIELDELGEHERAADREVTPTLLAERAAAILAPYTIDVKDVAWCSAYEIGQRVCDSFDDVPDAERATRTPRIFIAGDACHTHSPKAGQGMNVSMADAFNLGWKLASVIRGHAHAALLHTYSEERQAKARELIEFDRDMARLFSQRDDAGAVPEVFQEYFSKHARYTAGVETRYEPSLITAGAEHQSLAAGLPVGMRFHSAPVIRLADAKPMELGHTVTADGRWRLFAFAAANDRGQTDGAIAKLCDYLATDATSPLRRHTPPALDIDAVIDLRAVFQQHHYDLELDAMPSLLLPTKGRHALVDYEKIFCPDLKRGPDVFDLRAIDRAVGALVIVRPDQYVAAVLPLDALDSLARFFEAFLLEAGKARAVNGAAVDPGRQKTEQ